MARRSSVEQKLPDDVLADLNREFANGATLDEVVAWLQENHDGDQPSRSSLGRYRVNQDELNAKLKESRIMATALGRQFAETAEDDTGTGRIAIEMLQSVAMKMMAGVMTGKVDIDPKEMNFAANALKNMMSATDIDDKRRKRIREEVLLQAAEAVDQVVKQRGLTGETAADIRKRIMGVNV